MLTPGAGLYDPMYEHDACGLGFVARIDGRRTRETVEEGLEVLHNLEHRGTTVRLYRDVLNRPGEHQNYLLRYPAGYTCHFVRPNWVLPRRSDAVAG